MMMSRFQSPGSEPELTNIFRVFSLLLLSTESLCLFYLHAHSNLHTYSFLCPPRMSLLPQPLSYIMNISRSSWY